VPSVTHGAVGAEGPACTGVPVSLEFWSEGSRLYGSGKSGALSYYVCPEAGLKEPGAVRRLQGLGIDSIVLQVIFSIPPVVSCFSICGLGEGFASCWLWDSMGFFLGPLIFPFQGS
jgi:tetrahydromethanopterin S-methyltransferase subunit D